MDQTANSIGISCLAPRQPQSLTEWNAQYEAQSLRHDWWFKAAVAVIASIRSAVETIVTQPATAPQLAHA